MFKPMLLFCSLLSYEILNADYYTSTLNTPQTFQEEDFAKQMNDAITRAENEVKSSQYNATRRDNAPTWNSKLEYQNAVLQLEVKKTLVNNFKNTESLKSALVRQKLLQVLNKPMVTTADLAELQNAVLQEKTRMRNENPPVVPVPTNSKESTEPPSTNRLPTY